MRSIWLFFAIALGGTWALQLPALLAVRGVLPGGVEPYMLPALLGGFCPLIAAVIAAGSEGGGALGMLFGSLKPRARHLAWYAAALLAFPVVHVLGEAAYRVVTGEAAGAWLYLPTQPQQVAALVMMPLVEEPGWRGFAMPRLAARFGWLRASGMVGVLWAAWHALMFVLQGFDAPAFALGMVMIASGGIVFGWLFERTQGSLLVAVIAHAGVHLDNPTRALPQQLTAYAVFAGAVCIAAALCIVVGGRRAAHSDRPRSAAR